MISMETMEEADDVRHLFGRETTALSPTEIPAYPAVVSLGFAIFFICLFSLLFLLVYVELILILCYKHKRLSYQTAFLFLCLVWCALRTTLFTFYFRSPVVTNNFAGITFWFFFCCPSAIQFVTLVLLVLYFAQVVLKSKTKYANTYQILQLRLALALAILIFLTTNIVCAIVIRQQQKIDRRQPYEIITARVFISELLFLTCGVSLGVCLYKLNRTTMAKINLESTCATYWQTSATCALILLYVSRAVYNLAVVAMAIKASTPSFNYSWINVTDQSEIKGFSYIAYGVVLFVWEFLPTLIVVALFHVRRPINDSSFCDITSRSYHSGAFVFDNPRRYDSDEELCKRVIARSDYSGQEGEYHVERTNRVSSPYGSFHSSYVFRHGSHTVTGGTATTAAVAVASTSRGYRDSVELGSNRFSLSPLVHSTPPERSPLTQRSPQRSVVINVHVQQHRPHLKDYVHHSDP